MTERMERIDERIAQATSQGKAAKLLKTAIKYGVIKPGWSCIDYMYYAAKHHGWESNIISGPKGTLKSNLLLQHGMAIYKDMDEVKKHFITGNGQKLFDLMQEALDHDVSIPWVGIDDIATIFPGSMYFSDRSSYSEMQSTWEASRTVINCFEASCVIKRKVAKFILEDVTGDIKCYNPVFIDHADGSYTTVKSHYDYRRWLWLRNIKDPTADLAKLVTVEDIPFPATPDAFKFDNELKEGTFFAGGKQFKGEEFFKQHAGLFGIETSDFKDYWNDRLAITKIAFKRFMELRQDTAKLKEEKKQRKLLSHDERAEINRENALRGHHPERY